MFTVIVRHHPVPEHTEAFIDFMRDVVNGVSGADGLIEFRACQEATGEYLAGVSTWQRREAFQAALPTIMGFGERRDPAWSAKPDDRITLIDL